jgi:hypothetical protein
MESHVMSVPVKLEDLRAACEWISADTLSMDCEAYVSRTAGTVHWLGDGVEEEAPEDLDDGALYIAVPGKADLDLGRPLAFAFVDEHLPHARDTVREYFRQRGAYAKFKSLLASSGQLDAWYNYEEAATQRALRDWCEVNGFVPVL